MRDRTPAGSCCAAARRVSLAALGAALCLALAYPGVARAIVKKSEIVAPANPSYLLYDGTAGEQKFTVSGTTEGSGNVDINCYYEAGEVEPLEEEVEPTAHTFSVEISTAELPERPCVLRAVPEGDVAPHPPGSPSAFTGPEIAPSDWSVPTDSSTSAVFNYELEDRTLSSALSIESAGACGLDESDLFSTPLLAEGDTVFYCDGVLSAGNDRYVINRSALQVDGHNAYDAFAAHSLYQSLKPSTPSPSLTVSGAIDPATGLVTIHESEPLVVCSGSKTVFPETKESCESLAPAGVALERTWRSASDGRILYLTDAWSSTDGKSHSLDALYGHEMFEATPGGAYRFPGSSEFAGVSKGQTVALPAGAGMILYKEKATAPEGGEYRHPAAAIAYDVQPSGSLTFTKGTGEAKGTENEFNVPFAHTVPASGAYVVRLAYAQEPAVAEAQSLAAGAIASFAPSIAIGSPAGGSTLSTPTVEVSGTASDTGVLESVSVNGVAATLGAGGAWSATVPLVAGANTITATATDQAGLTKNASVEVTYEPEPEGVAPAVTKQPVPATVLAGEHASFEAEASGEPAPSIQWESSSDGGAHFSALAGATSKRLEVATTLADNGHRYRATFKNHFKGSDHTVSTDAATLTVVEPEPEGVAPAVTKQPVPATVLAGEHASFEAEASGEPAPSIQWESSSDGARTSRRSRAPPRSDSKWQPRSPTTGTSTARRSRTTSKAATT